MVGNAYRIWVRTAEHEQWNSILWVLVFTDSHPDFPSVIATQRMLRHPVLFLCQPEADRKTARRLGHRRTSVLQHYFTRRD